MIGTASYARTLGRLVALGVGVSLLSFARQSRADNVPATGKGIVGGALLGGEVVMLGEAAFQLKPGWAYLLGGVVGAGGGAALGYLAEQNADSKVSVYMLAGGMALAIPTTVAVLQAMSYTPPEDYTEDRPPPGAPLPEPPLPGTSPVPPTPTSPALPTTEPVPGSMLPTTGPGASASSKSLYLHYHWSQPAVRVAPGLVQGSDDGLRLSVPALEVRPLYSMVEMAKYGVNQQQELRLTVFSAVF